MPTLKELTDSLKSDRTTIVNNLTTMGITGLTGNETFTELAPEILNIVTTTPVTTDVDNGTQDPNTENNPE